MNHRVRTGSNYFQVSSRTVGNTFTHQRIAGLSESASATTSTQLLIFFSSASEKVVLSKKAKAVLDLLHLAQIPRFNKISRNQLFFMHFFKPKTRSEVGSAWFWHVPDVQMLPTADRWLKSETEPLRSSQKWARPRVNLSASKEQEQQTHLEPRAASEPRCQLSPPAVGGRLFFHLPTHPPSPCPHPHYAPLPHHCPFTYWIRAVNTERCSLSRGTFDLHSAPPTPVQRAA